MKIYIAGSFNSQERLNQRAKELEQQGHIVTSRWLNEVPGLNPQDYARIDLEDIDQAQLVIFDLLDPSTTGGRDVEFGYAYANGQRTWTIGPQYGIFYSLSVGQFVDWEAALFSLRRLNERA